MKKAVLLSLSLLLASSALAGEVLIPVVYRGAGANGTLWRTEIVLSNISAANTFPVPTTITFHRDNGESLVVQMPLSPREVIAIPDAVHDWYSLESAGGIVRVTWDNQPDVRIAARARIYNVGGAGEYGQSVPGVDTSRLVSDHYLTGLTGIGGNRTNIGISNPTNTATIVWIELFDTSGLSRGSFATGVGPRTFRQINDIFSQFQAGPLNAAMVRVTSMNTIVYAYASIVRDDTGDATFVATP